MAALLLDQEGRLHKQDLDAALFMHDKVLRGRSYRDTLRVYLRTITEGIENMVLLPACLIGRGVDSAFHAIKGDGGNQKRGPLFLHTDVPNTFDHDTGPKYMSELNKTKLDGRNKFPPVYSRVRLPNAFIVPFDQDPHQLENSNRKRYLKETFDKMKDFKKVDEQIALLSLPSPNIPISENNNMVVYQETKRQNLPP